MEVQLELELEVQATDAEVIMVPHVLVTMEVLVASADQKADLIHHDRIREAMLALRQQFQDLAFNFLECHQHHLVDFFVEGGAMGL